MTLNPKSKLRKRIIIASCTVFLILSAIDEALTHWGFGLNAIEEADPLMQWMIEKSPYVFLALKLLLPIILLVLLIISSKFFVTYSLGFIVVVYSLVMVLHAYWVVSRK